MGITVQVRHGGTETRYRLSVERPDLASLAIGAKIRAAWRDEAVALVEEVTAQIEEAYPKILDLEGQVRVTAGKIFLSWSCSDPRLKYWEYDTEPHWPPFGKGSLLREWCDARGLSAFGVAWHMAPISEGGGGGKRSYTHPGRFVATSGQYFITNRVPRAEIELLNRMVTAMFRVRNGGP